MSLFVKTTSVEERLDNLVTVVHHAVHVRFHHDRVDEKFEMDRDRLIGLLPPLSNGFRRTIGTMIIGSISAGSASLEVSDYPVSQTESEKIEAIEAIEAELEKRKALPLQEGDLVRHKCDPISDMVVTLVDTNRHVYTCRRLNRSEQIKEKFVTEEFLGCELIKSPTIIRGSESK